MFLSGSVPRHSSDGLEPIPRSVALATAVALSPTHTHTHTHTHLMHMCMYVQWDLSNPDTNGAVESVIVSEVSSFQRLKCMQEWYLGWEKVSCLERCPQFIERERGSTDICM